MLIRLKPDLFVLLEDSIRTVAYLHCRFFKFFNTQVPFPFSLEFKEVIQLTVECKGVCLAIESGLSSNKGDRGVDRCSFVQGSNVESILLLFVRNGHMICTRRESCFGSSLIECVLVAFYLMYLEILCGLICVTNLAIFLFFSFFFFGSAGDGGRDLFRSLMAGGGETGAIICLSSKM